MKIFCHRKGILQLSLSWCSCQWAWHSISPEPIFPGLKPYSCSCNFAQRYVPLPPEDRYLLWRKPRSRRCHIDWQVTQPGAWWPFYHLLNRFCCPRELLLHFDRRVSWWNRSSFWRSRTFWHLLRQTIWWLRQLFCKMSKSEFLSAPIQQCPKFSSWSASNQPLSCSQQSWSRAQELLNDPHRIIYLQIIWSLRFCLRHHLRGSWSGIVCYLSFFLIKL